jgi:hypothetical protein
MLQYDQTIILILRLKLPLENKSNNGVPAS